MPQTVVSTRRTPEDSDIEQALAHDVIQSGGHRSIPKGGRLTRAIQQHPRRELQRVEGIDPDDLPARV